MQEQPHWRRLLLRSEETADRYQTEIAERKKTADDCHLCEEKAELLLLKNEILTNEYDAILDHLPKQRSIPGHHHVHLIEFKRHDGKPR